MFPSATAVPAGEPLPDAEQPLKGTSQTVGDLLLSSKTSVCPH